jgi:3-dehydroquinate synthase
MTATPNPAPDFETVHVPLGDRAYDVLIGSGLIANAGALVRERTGLRDMFIVSDDNVAPCHLAPLQASFEASGLTVRGVEIVPHGEASKSWPMLQRVCDAILASGLERGGGVVALGGGVIGDLAGAAAGLVRRGVAMVQIPTSLLAQVDSSVGGKTGINTEHGKNLIGVFHQPRLVLADIDALDTLPDREVGAGYAEVAKYGLLGDSAFFDWLDGARDDLRARRGEALLRAVRRSVEMKAEIVARDETEAGDRALLNLGHTFGHALEAHAGYDGTLLHGEAVAIGMCQAFRFSEANGFAPPQSAARVAGHLKSMGLPTRVSDVDWRNPPTVDDILRLMMQDKKVRDGRLTLILVRGIGDAYITRDTGHDSLAAFIRGELASDDS